MSSLAMCAARLVRVGAVLLLGGAGLTAQAQISGEYVGRFGFYQNNNLAAELTIEQGWSGNFSGVLSFTHFEQPVGTQRARSAMRIVGRYDERYKTFSMQFKEWSSPRPHGGDWTMGTRKGNFDPAKQLLSGDGIEFALKGTPEAKRLESTQPMWDNVALRQREANDQAMKQSGQYAQVQREAQIDAAQRQAGSPGAGRAGAAVDPAAVPVEWPAIGLRITMREVSFDGHTAQLPYVEAVRENGPAYFAGLLPGDVVKVVNCGRSALDYLEAQVGLGRDGRNRPTAQSAPGVYTSAGPPVRNERFALMPAQACAADRTALIQVMVPSGDQAPARQSQLRGAEGSGAWLSDKVALVDLARQSRVRAEAHYKELRKRAFAELRNNPCRYDSGVAYDLKALPPIIGDIARARANLGGEEDLPYWRDVVQGYCEDERSGPLPSFETAVFQIGRGAMDPCSYDPKIDYTQVVEDADTRSRRFSRLDYESVGSVAYFLGKLAKPGQRKCMLDLIRAQIMTR